MADGPYPMVTTRHGIEYEFQRTPGAATDSDYKEFWSPDLVNSSFVAKVAWDDSDMFVLDMIGEHSNGGNVIFRHNPEKHPFNPKLYCVGCESLDNLGVLSVQEGEFNRNAGRYEYIRFRCTFAAFLYDILNDDEVHGQPQGEFLRYVQRKSRQNGQSLQASVFGVFEYESPNSWDGTPAGNNLAIPTPPAIQIPYREIMYIWHYVPGSIEQIRRTSDSYYGTLNSVAFDGRDAGTLMYMGMDEDQIPSTPAGNELWRITHKINFFKHGWNRVYRPNGDGDDGDWDGVRNRETGEPPYASNDFYQLFVL